jgi:hypothetical protein
LDQQLNLVIPLFNLWDVNRFLLVCDFRSRLFRERNNNPNLFLLLSYGEDFNGNLTDEGRFRFRW